MGTFSARSRVICGVLVAAAFAAAPFGVASGRSVDAGHWNGVATSGLQCLASPGYRQCPLNFYVTSKPGRKVVNLLEVNFQGKCNDGSMDSRGFADFSPGFAIGSRGNFKARGVDVRYFAMQMVGRFTSAKRVQGTMHAAWADVYGHICDTGIVKWRATLKTRF